MTGTSTEIETAAYANCAVCGTAGVVIYDNLIDRLFRAPGKWRVKKCSNRRCGLAWLDPMPLPTEIWKAYVCYYTHRSASNRNLTGLRKLERRIKDAFLEQRLGYPAAKPTWPLRCLANALWCSPIHKMETEAEVRFLPAQPHGRLLDVGCGSGDWLSAMQKRGWDAEGLDFDAKAVEVAKSKGILAKLGSLEDQLYPSNLFDAITLSHVIEHVPNPKGTIQECLRILKPGGTLVILTPNCESLSHQFFGSYWRGLEPPRHLHIFTLGSMSLLLKSAGFAESCVRPFIVTSVIYDSLQMKLAMSSRNRNYSRIMHYFAWTFARLFKIGELILCIFRPSAADCLVASATKT